MNKNNYANLFDVINKTSDSYYNLHRGLRFDNVDKMSPDQYSLYEIKETDAWTIISYKFYKTIELWWLICKFNGIRNPIKELIPGKVIKIPNDEIKDMVLTLVAMK